jgi:hypothetical protein
MWAEVRKCIQSHGEDGGGQQKLALLTAAQLPVAVLDLDTTENYDFPQFEERKLKILPCLIKHHTMKIYGEN